MQNKRYSFYFPFFLFSQICLLSMVFKDSYKSLFENKLMPLSFPIERNATHYIKWVDSLTLWDRQRKLDNKMCYFQWKNQRIGIDHKRYFFLLE